MHSLLDEPVKQQTTSPSITPVEAERIFVEVVVEMFVANRPLVRAQDPTLEQCGYSMNSGHRHVCWISASGDDGLFMYVPVLVDAVVSRPTVSANNRAWRYHVADERR